MLYIKFNLHVLMKDNLYFFKYELNKSNNNQFNKVLKL